MAENTIKFRGQDVTLKYPLYALGKLEEQGLSLTELGEDSSVSTIIKLSWAGLICQFPDATVDEVGMQFEMKDISDLSAAIQKAMKTKGK